MATNAVEVSLKPADIPGADLKEPFETHAMPALRWWLLCRGIRAPSSWKKQQVGPLSTSMKVSVPLHFTLPVVDVDGSYLERKHKQMVDASMTVCAPTGWLGDYDGV